VFTISVAFFSKTQEFNINLQAKAIVAINNRANYLTKCQAAYVCLYVKSI